jgi:L-alanine-DL-glutamate epimerase-like enolase superfamily enzyme
MKITDIETIILRMPEPVLPNGDNLQDILIIRVHTDEGITGIGEAHTAPTVLKAVIDAPISHLTTQGLKPLLIGKDPRRINELWELMVRHTASYGRRGVVMQAISGVDIALWDLLGKVLGKPIHQLFAARCGIRCRPTPGPQPRKRRRHDRAGRAACRRRIHGHQVRWAASAAMCGPTPRRWARCARRWVRTLPSLLDMGTPVPFDEAACWPRASPSTTSISLGALSPDDLDGFSKLVTVSPTPSPPARRRPDASLPRPHGARRPAHHPARRRPLRRPHRNPAHRRLAEMRGVRVIPHCWSTDILVAATLHFLAAQKDAPWQEFNVMDNPLKTDHGPGALKVVNGRVRIPDGPGLGIALNEEIIERYRWTPAG